MTMAVVSASRRRSGIVATVFGAAVGLVFLLPLWWAFINSLRPSGDTFRFISPVGWQTFFRSPRCLTTTWPSWEPTSAEESAIR
jgi:ABC-type glycerol-3-phosphate transport system permease component